jgi:O-antigen/teichoic acid export membrane protein
MTAARLHERARADAADPLLRSAYSLTLNGTLTAGLGVVFWIVAARLYEPDAVGRDAALISAMMNLSVLSLLNLNNAVTRFLPSLERGTARALLRAYGASGAAALAAGVAFVSTAPLISNEFAFFRDDWLTAALYVCAQVLWTWFVLQDAALTAVRRAPWVIVDNGLFGVLKLVALPVLAAVGAAHGVFTAWVLPVAALLVPINYLLFRRFVPHHVRVNRPTGSSLSRRGRRRLVGFLAQDYGATVLRNFGFAALPLLVVAAVGSAGNAYFYIPFAIVVVFDELFYAVGRSLVVEGALAEHKIKALAHTVVRRFVLILVPGVLLLVSAAPLILLPFGQEYVGASTPVLRVLACASIFQAAIALYGALARLQGLGLRILAVQAVLTALLLLATLFLAEPLGPEGVALAWLGSSAVVALAILPSLVRFLRSGGEDDIGGQRMPSSSSRGVVVP